MEVKVLNDNFEKALKYFKRKVDIDGFLKLLKRRHDGYDPPSVKRRNKHFRAVLRLKRMERRSDDN